MNHTISEPCKRVLVVLLVTKYHGNDVNVNQDEQLK